MLLTVSAATTVQFNLGLPSFLGLSVTSNVNVNLTSDYLLDFSFDPTTNALAIKNTDLTTQAAALPNASLPHDPFAITLSAQPATKTIGSGQLDNFLLATVTDNGTQLTGTIGVAIDSFNGATVSFFGEAAVNLNLSLSFGAGDIPLDPTLTTGLKFDWQFSNYQPVDTSTPNTFGSIASLEFTGVNITTDLGTIGTIISDIQDYTEPLQPIINILNDDIPGLSSLGIKTQLITLLLDLAGASDEAPLVHQFFDAITDFNKIVIPSSGTISFTLINAFTISDPRPGTPAVQGTPDAPDAGTIDDEVNDQSDSPGLVTAEQPDTSYGLQFPIFDDPVGTIIPLLLGKDVNLFTYTLQPINIPLAKITIPIGSIPPFIPIIALDIGASLGLDFSVGYDTAGLRELVSAEIAGTATASVVTSDVLHGFYVDDTNTYINFYASFSIEIDAYIVSVTGGIYGEIGIVPIPDDNPTDIAAHRTRLDFLIGQINSVGGIFSVFEPEGSIGLDFSINVGIELGIVDVTVFSIEIGPIPLITFAPPAPPPQISAPTIYVNETENDDSNGNPSPEQIHVHQTTYADSGDSSLIDSAIEVDYPDSTAIYPTGQFTRDSQGNLDPVVPNPFPHYTQIVTTSSGPIDQPQAIVVGSVNSFDANGNPTPINAVLIGGSANDDLEYTGSGQALLIGGAGSNALVDNGANSSALEFGNTIDPNVTSPLTGGTAPAWIDNLPPNIQSEITAEIIATSDTTTTDALTGPGGDDFLEGGAGTNTFLESGSNFTIVGEGQTANAYQITEADSQGPAPAGTIDGLGPKNVLIVNRIGNQNGTLDHLSVMAAVDNDDTRYLELAGTNTNIAVFGTFADVALNLDGGTLDLGDLSSLPAITSIFITENQGSAANAITLEAADSGKPGTVTVGTEQIQQNSGEAATKQALPPVTALTESNPATNANVVFQGLTASDLLDIKLNGGSANIADLDDLGPETIDLDGASRGTINPPANTITIDTGLGDALTMTNDGSGGAALEDGSTGMIVDILGSLPGDSTTVEVEGARSSSQPVVSDTFAIDASALAGTLAIDGDLGLDQPNVVPVPESYIVTAVGPKLSLLINAGAGTNSFDIIHGGSNNNITLESVGGTNSLTLERKVSSSEIPDSLTLAPTANPGSSGSSLNVTGTGTSLTAYNIPNIQVDMYGGTLDVYDLSSLGASVITVAGVVSPKDDPNHVIIEAPASGGADNLTIGAGLAIADTATHTNYSITGLVKQDDVRVKLNGGGTETVNNIDQLGPNSIELDSRSRPTGSALAGNDITIVGPYRSSLNPGGVPIPLGLNVVMGTDAAGDPFVQDQDSAATGPIVIQGSVKNDSTNISLPVPWFYYGIFNGNGSLPGKPNSLTIDASKLEGSIAVTTPLSAGAPVSYEQYSFYPTNVTVDALGAFASLTYTGLDPSATGGYSPLTMGSTRGESHVDLGAAHLDNIQGSATIHDAFITVDNSASADADLLTLTTTTLSGWANAGAGSGPILTFDATVFTPFLIDAGAAEDFNILGTPAMSDAPSNHAAVNQLTISNTTKSIPPELVAVTGVDPSLSLDLTGDFALAVGQKLSSTGAVTFRGDVTGVLGAINLDDTAGNTTSVVLDASSDTFIVDGELGYGNYAPGLTGISYYEVNGPGLGPITFNNSGVSVTIDSTKAATIAPFENNQWSTAPGLADALTFSAAALTPGITTEDDVEIAGDSAPVNIAGNGDTKVRLFGAGSSAAYTGFASSVTVTQAASLEFDDNYAPTPAGPVTMSGSTLTGLTGGPLSYTLSPTGSMLILLPPSATMTVNDTPIGATTTLQLANTVLSIEGTTGPLDLTNGSGQVTIGNGSLASIQGEVSVAGASSSFPVTIDDHAAAPATNVRFAVDSSIVAPDILGLAPAEIVFPQQSGGVTVSGPAGSTYSLTDFYSFDPTLYAGKGSMVTVNVGSALVLGAGQVNVGGGQLIGNISKVEVDPDPARPTDVTNLSINDSSDFSISCTLGDDPSGDLAAVFSSQYDGSSTVLYDGATTDLSVNTRTVVTVHDTGIAGTVIDTLAGATVTGTTGSLTLNFNQTYSYAPVVIGSGGSVQSIKGEVDLNGPATGAVGIAPLPLDDSSDGTARNISFATSSTGVDSVTGLAPAPIKFTAADFGPTISGGSGGNTFAITDTASGAPVVVDAGAGSDTINVTVAGTGGYSPLSVDGQGGTNSLSAAGNGDSPAIANLPSATMPGSGTLQATYPPPGPTRSITYANVTVFPNVLAATTTTLAWSSASGYVYYDQPITLTATVADSSPGQMAPTGSVTFVELQTNTKLGVGTLSNGVASISAVLPVSYNQFQIVAEYQGDTTNSSSYSATLNLYDSLIPTTTTVTSSANPAVAGQTVVFSATVAEMAPGKAIPNGYVDFLFNGVDLPYYALNAQGVATLTLYEATPGSFTISANYDGGDRLDGTSQSSDVTEVITTAPTTTTLTSSLNPALPSQSVTLTAHVQVNSPGSIVPTGLVTFFDGTTAIGTVAPDSVGTASVTTSFSAIGNHLLTAVFAGDSYDATSTSAVTTESVGLLGTVTTIGGTGISNVGEAIDIGAEVLPASGTGTPTGSVTFFDGTTSLGSYPLPSYRLVTLATSSLTYGTHEITAVYSGDSVYATSTSAPFEVDVANIAITLTPDTTSSVFGQPISVETTFTGLLAGDPVFGYVSYSDGSVPLSTVYTNGNSDFFVTFSDLAPGPHQISAYFGGNGVYPSAFATTPTLNVAQDGTTTSLSVSPTTSTMGQSVTLTTAVIAQKPGSGVATGTVTFYDGKVPIGNATIDASGDATYTTSDLPLGTDDLTAVYGGDTNFITSTSPASPEQVLAPIGVSVALAASTLATTETDPVTFTATVTPADTTLGTPGGQVAFLDGSTVIGTVPLVDGVASFTTTFANGVHMVTASYASTEGFAAGNSSADEVVIHPNLLLSTIGSNSDPNASTSAGVIVDSSGDLYGVTSSGGDFGLGVAYEIPNNSGTVVILASFLDNSAASVTGLAIDANGDLFGSSENGGDGGGTVFEIAAGSDTVSTLFYLDQIGDQYPQGSPVVDAAGDIFGATESGGDFGDGAVFEAQYLGGGYLLSNLDSFQYGVTGVGPTSGLVVDSAGNLYGTTSSTSSDIGGTVYELMNHGDGTYSPITTLATFDGINQQSAVGLTIDGTGDIFGVSDGDGPTGNGTVFEVVAGSGVVSQIAPFDNANGSDPNPALVLDTAGDLFGTTRSGGLFNGGTAFEIVAGTGTISTLETFGAGGSTLVNPAFGLASDGTGTLFGVTVPQATAGPETLFALTPNDAVTTLTVTSDVTTPVSGQSVDLTATVGSPDATGTVTFFDGGTVLGSTPVDAGQAILTMSFLAGKYTITAMYSGDAQNPQATGGALEVKVAQDTAELDVIGEFSTSPVYLGESGELIALVQADYPGAGTPTGTITLYDNASPIATLALNFGEVEIPYTAQSAGMHQITITYSGDSEFVSGQQSDVGFDVSPLIYSTTTLTSSASTVLPGQSVTLTATVAAAIDTNGVPTGSVTFFDGGTAIGDAPLSPGGVATVTVALPTGFADLTAGYSPSKIWSASTSPGVGVLTTSYTVSVVDSFFGASTGTGPVGTPAVDAKGNLFGTTTYGGDIGDGTVYELARGASVPTTLASFEGEDGAYPYAGLVMDAQGDLFGTTSSGGLLGNGTVFEIVRGSDEITVLASFNDPGDGTSFASLAIDPAGDVFGVFPTGGDSGNGAVFEVPSGSGEVIVLASFEGDNGNSPNGVTLDSKGNLYGTTIQGGTNGAGTLFEIADGSQAITTLASFGDDNGSYPLGTVTIDGRGDLFGTTDSGGLYQEGTVFEVAQGTDTLTTLASFGPDDSDGPAGPLAIDAQGDLFGIAGGLVDNSYGAAFEVVSGSDQVTTIAALPFPRTNAGGLAIDAQGDLYGLSPYGFSFQGGVFEIAPALSATTLDVSSSATTAYFGQAVDLTATISDPTATGTVTFQDGTTSLGVAPVKAGSATLTGLQLAVGTHSITAVYSGDITDGPGTSPVFLETISPATTTTSVSASANPASFGQAVTFTATVSTVAPGSGTPTGTVQFVIDKTNFGAPVTLADGVAVSMSINSLALGSHTVSAVFVNADGNFDGETGTLAGGLSVVTPLTITTLTAPTPDPRNTAVDSVDITFSTTVNVASFTSKALALSVSGKAVPLPAALTLTLVSGTTYQISGLDMATAAQGLYSLTVNAAYIQGSSGNTGSGTLSTSWLMDSTAPSSTISPLPKIGNSLVFPVTVTGTVRSEPAGGPTVDITSFAVYEQINGGAWKLWQTLTPSAGTPNSATANYLGSSNTVYAFYAVATDNAGNTQSYNPSVEASTDLPNLTTPATEVTSSSTYNGDGTFTLNLAGADIGGNGLAYFEVYVAVGAGLPAPVLAGPAIPAGLPDATGTYHATMTYVMPAADYGSANTYRFYSMGIDYVGHEEPAHSAYDQTFTESYSEPGASQLAVSAFTVEQGAVERSYVRYLDFAFNDSTPSVLQAIASSVNNPTAANPAELTLTQFGLDGSGSGTPVSLQGLVSVVDNAIEIDFGVGGIEGKSGSIAPDGYYALSFKPTGSQSGVAATHHFYRLLGDVNGDGEVDQNDINAIAAAKGESVAAIALAIGQPATSLAPLSMDVNGDGVVNAIDQALASLYKGRKLTLPVGDTLG
jgi:uncharacterized repeat protein (TIGR03803 family)